MSGFENLKGFPTKLVKTMVKPENFNKPSIIFSNENSEILFRAESAVKSVNDIPILGQGNMRKQLLKIRL